MRSAARIAALLMLGAMVGLQGCGRDDVEPAPPVTVLPDDERPTAAPSPTEDPHADLDIWVAVTGGVVPGQVVESLEQQGRLDLKVEVASLHGGTIQRSSDRDGALVLDFPDISLGSAPPRAIVRLTPIGTGEDQLSPERSDFRFGADFRKDEVSTGALDSGDNVIQRGLASDTSQFKLEVDGGRPTCLVQGPEGVVEVRADLRVSPDRWYRAECARVADSVTVTVVEYLPEGGTSTSSKTASGPIGSLTWDKPLTPVSIGGKLAADGSVIRRATDQFNGLLSNPMLDLGG